MTFRLGGCKITVNFYFFGMLAAAAVFDHTGTMAAGLIAAAVHECGHLILMRLTGDAPRSISIKFLGIMIEGKNDVQNVWAALGGVIANLLAAAVSCTALSAAPAAAAKFIGANLALGVMNMMPVQTLDGGAALLLMLIKRFPADKAERLSMMISIASIVPVVTAGLYIMTASPGNFSLLLLGLWMIAMMLSDIIPS